MDDKTIGEEVVKIIQSTRANIEKLIIKTNGKSFENERICISVDNLLTEFETVIDTIDYYSKPSKEGYLIENSNGVFEIEYTNGGSNYPIYRGNNIEIFIDVDGWKLGRIDRNPGDGRGYYFYNEKPEIHTLYNGMKARLRVDDFTRSSDIEITENGINAVRIGN